MSEVKAVYASDPGFPATAQHPLAARFVVGGYVVDAIGGLPTQAEVDAAREAGAPAEAVRHAGLEADAQQTALRDRLRTNTAAQIDAYVDSFMLVGADVRGFLRAILKHLAVRR